MYKYGMTAETMKWRRRITTRWRKITDIAFSSTVKASELKNTIVASSTQPITPRWSRKRSNSEMTAADCPGISHSR